VIVGGGMAGLCAAWKLAKSGVKDFLLLELEPDVGGNSRSGSDPISAYPWGAHYVPLPDKSVKNVCELLSDLGAIKATNRDGEPIFEDRFLCFAPQERLFIHGRWQEDLFPSIGALSSDIHQHEAFKAAMLAFKKRRGRDGKRAFAIPVEESSQDPELLALDRISMEDYLHQQGWNSSRLAWYVNYACRDDFGLLSRDTSAWAGIHYWASRPASFEENDNTVLTWPEGNGWIVDQLRKRVGSHCRTGALVTQVNQNGESVSVDYRDVRTGENRRVIANQVILACPQFVAGHLIPSWRKNRPRHLDEFTYAPWMVANLWLSDPPEGVGSPPAWDNVLFDSDSLGYVVATHQNLSSVRPKSTIWTYYYPLAQGDPVKLREQMLTRNWEEWKTIILTDLSKGHPGLENHVSHIDVMLWGHGMIRPTPGFIWGSHRRRATQPFGNIHFAHSDLSGMSIFEEAVFRGFKAASAVLKVGGT
jgi:phytoene dehydrogenase-like protein